VTIFTSSATQSSIYFRYSIPLITYPKLVYLNYKITYIDFALSIFLTLSYLIASIFSCFEFCPPLTLDILSPLSTAAYVGLIYFLFISSIYLAFLFEIFRLGLDREDPLSF
jgi:hypothetical protein